MAQANVARRHGDEFQARLFWLKACALLDSKSPVIRVAYETGPKAFDDILVAYDPKAASTDQKGNPVYRRHIQCKWHTKAGTFGYADLVDPSFINAQQVSFLQRAHQAQTQHAPEGIGCQFELVTNWRIKPGDPLLELVRKESDALDIERLFEGKTDRSRMGQVRKLWGDHLGLDHAALSLVAHTLAIAETTESLASLRERLDERFAILGLKRVPASESAFVYDDLIAKLLAKGRVEFDRDSFAEMARNEGIFDEHPLPEDVLTIGVRSFIHPIDSLDDRCGRLLNLVPYFEGRYVRNQEDWQDRIFPELQGFVVGAARSADRLRLVLDAHVSLAFSIGSLLSVKSGKHVEIEQRTGGRHYWSMDDAPADLNWPRLNLEDEVVDESRDEIAIAVGLTHDVSPSVRAFVRQSLSQVGRIVHCKPETGPSQQSIACGRHAWSFTEALVQHLQFLRTQRNPDSQTHIFIAAPNGFAFFLGQHQQTIGPAAVYEWDFDGQRGGGYSLGLHVPRSQLSTAATSAASGSDEAPCGHYRERASEPDVGHRRGGNGHDR